MNIRNLALVAVITLGLGVAACEKKPETAAEKIEDKVKDGLDMRPHEKMKDAGEDAKKALDNAGDAVKDAVKPDPKK